MVFMRSKQHSSRCSGAFFSIDATFAILIAISTFAMLSAIVFTAGILAKSQAGEIRAENMALRFSSFVLEMASEGGTQNRSFASANEMNMGKFDSFFQDNGIGVPGASFARIRLVGSGGKTIAEESAGTAPPGNLHCVPRLALLEGKIVELEACIS